MVQSYMRKNQRLIWTVIAVVVVITFVFWGSMTGSGPRTSGSPGRIYGKDVSIQEYLDAQRTVNAYFTLFGRQDLTRTEQGRQILDQQTWLRLIERRKLEQWDITVTDDELIKFIQGVFQENGKFNPSKYQEFIDRQLPAMGIKPGEFEKMMREQLCLNRLQRIIGSTAKVTPAEARELFNMVHEKLDVSLVTFDAASYTNQVKLTDAEVKDYFEKNKETFRIPERRRVRYVRFGTESYTNEVKVADSEVRALYDKSKQMFADESGKPRPFESVAAEIRGQLVEQKAFQRATEVGTEFALALVKPVDSTQKEVDPTKIDFDAVAKKFGTTVKATEDFTLRAPVPGLNAGPYFNQAAFALTAKEPFSDAVSGQDGVYVLRYLDAKPSELPTLDAVKDKVVLRMTQERALELARSKGRDAARQVKNAVVAVKTDPGGAFAAAAQKLGLKVLSPRPFSQQDLEGVPDAELVLNVAFSMHDGEVSDFIDSGRGGLFLLLKQRIEPTDAEYAKDQKQFEEQLLQRKRELAYNDWANQQIMIAKPPFLTRPQKQPQGQPAANQLPPS